MLYVGPRAKRIDELDQMKVAELKAACKEIGLKASGKKAELKERLVEHILKHYPEDPEDGEKSSDGKCLSQRAYDFKNIYFLLK